MITQGLIVNPTPNEQVQFLLNELSKKHPDKTKELKEAKQEMRYVIDQMEREAIKRFRGQKIALTMVTGDSFDDLIIKTVVKKQQQTAKNISDCALNELTKAGDRLKHALAALRPHQEFKDYIECAKLYGFHLAEEY
jgi:hypothetical protein